MTDINSIPIIDLFAGPGGLGEGFSAFKGEDKNYPFKIKLSIEKDLFAHQTLLLRSFFRQFPRGKVPVEYYKFIKDQNEKKIDDLLDLYPSQGAAARAEAMQAELGGENHTPEEIDSWITRALAGEDKWVLIGGPPCQAYSTAGRSRNKAIKGYRPEKDNRHFLYLEYLRIISSHWPAIFLMENVRGILSSKVKKKFIFPEILKDLQAPSRVFNGNGTDRKHSYRIYSLIKHTDNQDIFGNPIYKSHDFTIKCEEYGIPQARHRVILLGIRDDCENIVPEILKQADLITTEEVLADLPILRGGVSRGKDSPEAWQETIISIQDEQWVSDLANSDETQDIAQVILRLIQEVEVPENGRGNDYIRCKVGCSYRKKWFHDWRLKGVYNSTTKEHISSDLKRYFFASCYAMARGRSPLLSEFPEELRPLHKSASKAIGSINFADRFRVQVREKPATTVMSHIAKDGHYYIHYDPLQCRSLTVREAARLQTFPDNYYFMGSRTQQYTQVGNAVPPLLALQIAGIIYNIIRPVS
ncbi:DNA cytosine methyltransferase [Thermodesulfobacteriota bacterium]